MAWSFIGAKVLFAKLSLNWPIAFDEEDFSSMYKFAISLSSVAHHLNKLISPLPKKTERETNGQTKDNRLSEKLS